MESYGSTGTNLDNNINSTGTKKTEHEDEGKTVLQTMPTSDEEEDCLFSKEDDSLLREKSKNEEEKKKSKGGYPRSVFFILGTEFCERFSYYGMRAILILYLTKWLKFDTANATGVYHGFIFLCYFSPIIGAILADGYLGRYKTIFSLSIMYAMGNVLMSVTAVPPPEWYGPMVALLLIGIGTGGIKPCVSAFGGDQFKPEQTKERETFFSVFYFSINLGSMMSMLLTPTLRADVHCFGEECYPLAFGVPAVLMVIALVIFVAGAKLYKKFPPTGNLIGRVLRCIFHGIKGKITHSDKRPHWLDHAGGHFEQDFIEEVKRLLKVLIICIPLPLYWALSDQQGSKWTLQAEQLDGSMGPFGRLKPDQLQALNPILILVLIPLFEKLIYPCLEKCKIPNSPLQRMSCGMILNAVAFVMAAFVQLKIDSQFESPLTSSESGLTLFNSLPCKVSISSLTVNQQLDSYQISNFYAINPGNITWNISADCSNEKITNKSFVFKGEHSYRLLIQQYSNKSVDFIQVEDQRKKSKTGSSLLSVLSVADDIESVKLVPNSYTGPVTAKTGSTFDVKNFTHKSVEPESYKIFVLPKNGDNSTDWSQILSVELGIGGIYTLLLYSKSGKTAATLFTTVKENILSMFVMIPQYIVITIGEILFSITGLSFGYSQAPKSMKSFVQAAFLLTVAFGNLLVAVISEIRLFDSQAIEFFFYAVIMVVDIILFMILACFYEYVKDVKTYNVEEDTSGLIGAMEMDDNFKTK